MACMEHSCPNCNRGFMDNEIYKACPYCKLEGITNWFDEVIEATPELEDEED